jgi:hypothetical protein
VTDSDPYVEWLHRISYLSLEETLALPQWQQPVALVQQLAMGHLNDGAGSLFYNDAEKIHPTAASLETMGETELSRLVLRIFAILSPIFDENPPDLLEVLVKQLTDGAATNLVEELDELIERRWDDLHSKMKAQAEANGWSP